MILLAAAVPAACGKKTDTASSAVSSASAPEGSLEFTDSSNEVQADSAAGDGAEEVVSGSQVSDDGGAVIAESEEYNANYEEVQASFDYNDVTFDMTKDQVVAKLGEPQSQDDADGYTNYNYDGCGWEGFGGYLHIGFDENGTIQKIQWEYIGPDADTRDQVELKLVEELKKTYGEDMTEVDNTCAWDKDGKHVEVQTMDSVSPYLVYTIINTSGIGAAV